MTNKGSIAINSRYCLNCAANPGSSAGSVFILALGVLLSASAKAGGFEYICIQPGDVVYTTAPSVEWPSSQAALKSEYVSDDLFQVLEGNRDVHVFHPSPDIEIRIDSADYEGEVIFDRVRFLVAQGRLYTWIGMRGTSYNGVAHKIIRSVRIRGHEIAKSKPLTVDVRNTLVWCN